MADENQELRRVSWTDLFSCTAIFKTWKMAKHYSKLLLAFVAIALICLVGYVMDCVLSLNGNTAHVSDVYAYYQAPSKARYADTLTQRDEANHARLVGWYVEAKQAQRDFSTFLSVYETERGGGESVFNTQLASLLRGAQSESPKIEDVGKVQEDVKKDWADVWRRYENAVSDMLDEADRQIPTAMDNAKEEIKDLPKDEIRGAKRQSRRDYDAARRALWKARVRLIDHREQRLFGRGLFCVLAEYEQHCVSNAFGAVRRGNVFTGLGRLIRDRQNLVEVGGPSDPAMTFTASTGESEAVGLVGWLVLMLYGPVWLFATHWLYAIIFGILAMAIWAVFGGAIARIAALHAAREDCITMGQALRFSVSKFLSFFTAPLILVVIILFIGFLLGVCGLLMWVPVLDTILSVLFLIALVLGAAIAFVSIGLIAGGPLMYPTIAVEGSDSFDAISRSFSYVFSRPWRYAFYTLVAAVYGTACYLFVRVFAYATLIATHTFMARGFLGGGLNSKDASELAEGAGRMDMLWSRPTFDNLAGTWNGAAMGAMDVVPAAIIRVWVFVVVGLVAAFVVSFTVSAFTNIYYLLRRKVDATDLDDVYIEEPEEDLDESEIAPELGEPIVEPAPAKEGEAEEPAEEAEEGEEAEKSED